MGFIFLEIGNKPLTHKKQNMKKFSLLTLMIAFALSSKAQLHATITDNRPGERNVLALNFVPINTVIGDADISVLQPAFIASLRIQSRLAFSAGYDFSIFSINNSTAKDQGTDENSEWAMPVSGFHSNHNLNLNGTFYPIAMETKGREAVKIGQEGNTTVYAAVKSKGLRLYGVQLGMISGLVPIAFNAEDFYGKKVGGGSSTAIKTITADNGLINAKYTTLKLGIMTTRITDLAIKIVERDNQEFQDQRFTDLYFNLLLPLHIGLENENYNEPPAQFTGFNDHYTESEYSINDYNEKSKIGFCAGMNFQNYKRGAHVSANLEFGSMPSMKGFGAYIKLGLGFSISAILG